MSQDLMEEENPRREHRRAAFFLFCRMRSNTRLSMSELGECPSAEARHGICKESGAKPDGAAEKHQAA